MQFVIPHLLNGYASIVFDSAYSYISIVSCLITAVFNTYLYRHRSYGTAELLNGWTYNEQGQIYSVIPTSGPAVGGNLVTINGLFLGIGTDITEVTLSGISATIVCFRF